MSNGFRVPRTAKYLFIGLGLVMLLRLVYVAGSKLHWVGGKELEIEFVITDSATGKPINNARIAIHQDEGGFCEDRAKKTFDLHTDERGRVNHRCGECMCFGTQRERYFGGWDEGSFATHTPDWRFQVSANGYETTELMWITEFSKNADRGEEFATLTVRIPLTRAQPNR